jgi:sucrose phosphorylase
MKNQVQLITYVDRLTGGGLKELDMLLSEQFKGLFGGIHLLPFFDPIDGTDAGFDPVDHLKVDSRLGDWNDVLALSRRVDVMADVIVNHVSADSPQFQDYLTKAGDSIYKGMFLKLDDVFPNGANEQSLLKIYRPRPGLPLTGFSFADGSTRLLWTTFTSGQIDINVFNAEGQKYLDEILLHFAKSGIKMIRLDAAGYAVKKPGTSCFMIPETFDFISQFSDKAKKLDMEVLVEIHAHYKTQIEIASKVDRVYDFALPPLILHALYRANSKYLKKWLRIAPRNAISVLDTHDGIGVMDVGSAQDMPGLLPPEEIEFLVEEIHRKSNGQSKMATGSAANNLDLYQVNCTYFDALGRAENFYLIARLIQFFSPGVPQVYYVGLLAGENDMDLLKKTSVGRDINRHYYSIKEVEYNMSRRVVDQLFSLIRFRNSHPAFNGTFSLVESDDHRLILNWQNGTNYAELTVDFEQMQFSIRFDEKGKEKFANEFLT